jgi:hypothetical protein
VIGLVLLAGSAGWNMPGKLRTAAHQFVYPHPALAHVLCTHSMFLGEEPAWLQPAGACMQHGGPQWSGCGGTSAGW